jgi:1,3-beta-glucanosyltransferase GAS1
LADDPNHEFLADPSGCARDIPYFQKLGINTITTNIVSPFNDFYECMTQLDAAGIYVLAYLSTRHSEYVINSTTPLWTTDMFDQYAGVIDVLQGYTNLLGFMLGDHIIGSAGDGDYSSAAFVKGAVRDLKSYMKSQDYRNIGIGYSLSDNATSLGSISSYLNCGEKNTIADFLGLDDFSWCGATPSFQSSDYNNLINTFVDFSVPTFLSQFGCTADLPRKFAEVSAIYSPNMTEVFSGGLAYEYIEESDDFGNLQLLF